MRSEPISKSPGARNDQGAFNGKRLTIARKRRGLSKTQLAERIGVDRRSVTGFETREFTPADKTLAKIAEVVEFPIEFFYGDDLEEPGIDTVSFRSMSKMSSSLRDIALGQGSIALLLNSWIEARFNLPAVAVPDLGGGTPEEAAVTLRQNWGLGELPVLNMIKLMESKGVRVFSLALESVEVDAYSMWKQSTPYVFLNTLKSSEHRRFDAAHELGHLVLHKHGAPQGRVAEQEAHDFASAFLMPRRSVLAKAPKFATIPVLIELKRYWNVSLIALTRRLHAVGALNDWQYRTLCIDMASKGYRTSEPNSSRGEASTLLPKVMAALKADGIRKGSLSQDLSIYESELDQLMFGLTLSGVRGGSSEKSVVNHEVRRQLKLVDAASN